MVTPSNVFIQHSERAESPRGAYMKTMSVSRCPHKWAYVQTTDGACTCVEVNQFSRCITTHWPFHPMPMNAKTFANNNKKKEKAPTFSAININRFGGNANTHHIDSAASSGLRSDHFSGRHFFSSFFFFYMRQAGGIRKITLTLNSVSPSHWRRHDACR